LAKHWKEGDVMLEKIQLRAARDSRDYRYCKKRLQGVVRRTFDSRGGPSGASSRECGLETSQKAIAQLLENACKYSPSEEPITVAVETNGVFMMTCVIDRGNGIDTNEQHLIDF
jgi:hypothetical protein